MREEEKKEEETVSINSNFLREVIEILQADTSWYEEYARKNPSTVKIPEWPERYLPYFKTTPLLFYLYKRWQHRDKFMLEDADYMFLWAYLFPQRRIEKTEIKNIQTQKLELWSPIVSEREAALKEAEKVNSQYPKIGATLLEVEKDKFVIYSRPVYFFILENRTGAWQGYALNFEKYYKIDVGDLNNIENNKFIEKAIVRSFFRQNPFVRLRFAMTDEVRFFEANWSGCYRSDVEEEYKEQLWLLKGCPRYRFETLNHEKFAKQFEQMWNYTKTFYDSRYNFSVTPGFREIDMFSYALTHKKYRNKYFPYQYIWEMIDWVVMRICPSVTVSIDHLIPNRTSMWKRRLLVLCIPMMDYIIKEIEKEYLHSKYMLPPKGKFKYRFSKQERERSYKDLSNKVLKIATSGYNYWKKKGGKMKDDDLGYLFPHGSVLEFSLYPAERLDKIKLSDRDRKILTEQVKWVRPSWYISLQLKKYLARSNKRENSLQMRILDQQFVHFGNKLHCSIRFLAEFCGCSQQTLRNLEGKGEIKFVRRSTTWFKHIRWFEFNKDNVEEVQSLLKKEKTLKGIAFEYEVSTRTLNRKIKEHSLGGLPKQQRNEKLEKILKQEGYSGITEEGFIQNETVDLIPERSQWQDKYAGSMESLRDHLKGMDVHWSVIDYIFSE